MRCAVGIGGQGVVWRVGRGVGSVVPLGLAGRAWCGWRCAGRIGGEGVVWVALCRWECMARLS